MSDSTSSPARHSLYASSSRYTRKNDFYPLFGLNKNKSSITQTRCHLEGVENWLMVVGTYKYDRSLSVSVQKRHVLSKYVHAGMSAPRLVSELLVYKHGSTGGWIVARYVATCGPVTCWDSYWESGGHCVRWRVGVSFFFFWTVQMWLVNEIKCIPLR